MLAANQPKYTPPQWLATASYWAEFVFLAIFAGEMLIKIVALGLVLHPSAYLRDAWNVFDCLIVVVSIATFYTGLANVTALRAFRVLRALRTVGHVKQLKKVLSALFAAIPSVGVTLIFVVYAIFLFAVLGLQIWAGLFNRRCYYHHPNGTFLLDPYYQRACGGHYNCPANYSCEVHTEQYAASPFAFDWILPAFFCVFCITTKDAWSDLMDRAVDAFGPVAIAYFVAVTMLIGTLLINLFLAILVDEYNYVSQHGLKKKEEQQEVESPLLPPKPTFAEVVIVVAPLHRIAQTQGIQPKESPREPPVQIEEKPLQDEISGKAPEEPSSTAQPLCPDQQDNSDSNLPCVAGVETVTTALPKLACSFKVKLLATTREAATPDGENQEVDYKSRKIEDDVVILRHDPRRHRNLVRRHGFGDSSSSDLSDASRKNERKPSLAKAYRPWEDQVNSSESGGDEDEKSSLASSLFGDEAHPGNDVPESAAEAAVLPSPAPQAEIPAGHEPSNADLQVAVQNRPSVQAASVPPPSWKVKMQAFATAFSVFMMLVTLGNVVILAYDHYGIDPQLERTLDLVSFICTCMFALELAIKCVAWGPLEVFTDRLNIIDTLAVVAGFIGYLLDVEGLAAFTAVRLLHIFHVFRFFRSSSVTIMLAALSASVVPACFVFLLLVVILYVYSVLGMQFFGVHGFGDDFSRIGYGTVWEAALSNFIVVVGNNWSLICAAGMQINAVAAVFFFVTLFAFGNFLFINLFAAVVIEYLDAATEKMWDHLHAVEIATVAREDALMPRLILPPVVLVDSNHATRQSLPRYQKDDFVRSGLLQGASLFLLGPLQALRTGCAFLHHARLFQWFSLLITLTNLTMIALQTPTQSDTMSLTQQFCEYGFLAPSTFLRLSRE